MPSKRQSSSSQPTSASARASPALKSSPSPALGSSNSTALGSAYTNPSSTTKNPSSSSSGVGGATTSSTSSTSTSKSSHLKSPAATSLKSPLASSSSASSTSPQEILATLWDNYYDSTPQRTKLIDAFMGFLVVVAVVQFVYCVLVGNYPFNAFLSGFSATVGQFVLTASLRIQTNPANQSDFRSISPERAFADFVLGSLILHFFCVNFIN